MAYKLAMIRRTLRQIVGSLAGPACDGFPACAAKCNGAASRSSGRVRKTRDATPGDRSPVYRRRLWLTGLCLSVLLGCGSESPTQSTGSKILIAILPGDVKLEMVWIEPGTFTMGADPGEMGVENRFEYPKHQVTLTRGFYIGKYEITQAQWESVMGTRPWEGQLAREGPDYPAVAMSWFAVQKFVETLNDTMDTDLFRLPTEAEWEYACRAGTSTRWSFGSRIDSLKYYAWYKGSTEPINEMYAHRVGTKLPNPWGLYDIHGNVREWVADRWTLYQDAPQIDPVYPVRAGQSVPDFIVIRSASFKDEVQDTRAAHRFLSYGSPDEFVGFRVVCEAP